MEVLESRGLKPKDVDCVLSGLPWAIFSKDLQRRILEQVASVLKPGGKFATFAYLQGQNDPISFDRNILIVLQVLSCPPDRASVPF